MNTPLLPAKSLALDLLLLLIFSHWAVSDSFATPWTVAHQASLSRGFPRQENYSGLPFPSPEDLPSPGTELTSPALTGRFFTTESPGKPIFGFIFKKKKKMLPAISVNDACSHQTITLQLSQRWALRELRIETGCPPSTHQSLQCMGACCCCC